MQIDPARTALILIDLQKGIVGNKLAPRSGADVVLAADALAQRFRAAGAPVVLVRVEWSRGFPDALRQPVDEPPAYLASGLPAGWGDIVDGLAQPGDIPIVKRQWGAFHGTELDLQLRRRGIDTVVLGGIATNFAVESTARQAWELGYAVIAAEDMTASFSTELHDMAIRSIFPRISRVVRCADIFV